MVQDTRPAEVMSLAQMRSQIEDMLRQQALTDYQKELREKAKVQ
jgi:peptidyl-prolyl cis-trans isomerase C